MIQKTIIPKVRSIFLGLMEKTGLSQKLSFQIGLLFSANIVNNGTGFLANILIARFWGQEIFGVFSLAFSVMLTTWNVTGFGMNLTMVRFFKKYQLDNNKKDAVVCANLFFRVIIFCILLIIAFFFSDFIALKISKDLSLNVIAVAIIGGGILSFWSFFQALFQSLDKFAMIAWMTLSYAVLRLFFLGSTVMLDIKWSAAWLLIGIYLIPISIISGISFYKLRKKIGWGKTNFKGMLLMLKSNIGYSKWIAANGISFNLIQKSLIFIVAATGDLRMVGLLSAGLIFTNVFGLINNSVQQILFPKVSELKLENIQNFKKKMRRILPFYFTLSLLILFILSLLMVFVLGDKYEKSLPIFLITGLGTAFTIGVGFYTQILHSINRPDVSAYVNGMTLFIFIFIGFWISRSYGLIPVVIFHTLILFLGELVKSAWLEKETRHLPVA